MALFLANPTQMAGRHCGALSVISLKTKYSTDAPRPLKATNLAALKRGTGGRSSFNGMVVTVFGCTGFVGRYVANKFGKIGSQCIFPYRGDHSDACRLKVVGDLGQVLFQFFSLNDKKSIQDAVKYSNVVVNLMGRDWETKCFKFDDVHVRGAQLVANVCKEAGVERLIHLSALNASATPEEIQHKGGSKFLRSKYYGECAVLDAFPNATIIRPADIYGQEDRFLRYYAHVWRRQFRGMPLWYKGERTIKQPVFVSDVAQAIINAAKDPDTAGKIYQAVGPRRYLLSELVDWFHREMRKDKEWGYWRYDSRYDPSFLAKIKFTEFICPGAPVGGLHMDRLEREYINDSVTDSLPTLEDLGVKLTYMEDQVPWELRPFRACSYYDAELGEFEKPSLPNYIGSKTVC